MEFPKPQLARAFSKKKDSDVLDSEKYIAEEKFDGHRILWAKGKTVSRLLNPKHIKFLEELDLPDGTMIDGEVLGATDDRSNDVSHLLANDQGSLKFVAFDILYHKGKNVMQEPLLYRKGLLEQVLIPFLKKGKVELSKVYKEGKRKLWKRINDECGEGIMLKLINSGYVSNSRSNWIKMKLTETFDVVVTDCSAEPSLFTVKPGHVGTDGILYPEGKPSSTCNNVGLSYGFYDKKTGKLVKVGSLGVTGAKEDMVKYVGKVCEVKSYGKQYESGALRHPVVLKWRSPDDKNATDCVFDFPEVKK